MTSYQDITRNLGDHWVSSLKQAEEAISAILSSVQDAAPESPQPRFEMPEALNRFTQAAQEGPLKASEIVQANFELTQRLLEAQRDLTLAVLRAQSTRRTDDES